ncbi:MAG: hypothetical protein EA402_14300 [Planctomycetota bacterium]|nr:MAG: hypothetical protein EA402_14300 [Planctomycetota bacterium]
MSKQPNQPTTTNHASSYNRMEVLAASLARVLRHIAGDVPQRDRDGTVLDDQAGHYAIFTVWRQDMEPEENNLRWVGLNRAIRARGLGYIRLAGTWLDYGWDSAGTPVDRTLFVPGGDNLTLEWAQEVGLEHHQDSLIYADPGARCGAEDGKNTRDQPPTVCMFEPHREAGCWDVCRTWPTRKRHSAQNIVDALEEQKDRLRAHRPLVLSANKTAIPEDPCIYVPADNDYESLGIAPAPIGTMWSEGKYRGLNTLIIHIAADPGYDGPRPQIPGCLH